MKRKSSLVVNLCILLYLELKIKITKNKNAKVAKSTAKSESLFNKESYNILSRFNYLRV